RRSEQPGSHLEPMWSSRSGSDFFRALLYRRLVTSEGGNWQALSLPRLDMRTPLGTLPPAATTSNLLLLLDEFNWHFAGPAGPLPKGKKSKWGHDGRRFSLFYVNVNSVIEY